MTIPVTTVTATFFDTNGAALPGVVLAATLSGLDVYNDQYVTNRYFTGTTNSSGVATLVLYTNSDGLRGTYYNFKVTYNGRVLSDSNVTLSGSSVNFADVEGNYDGGIINPPPGNYSITGNLTITGTLAAGATTLSSLTLTTPLAIAQGGTGADNPSTARANLELGSMSQQNANNVAITGGTIDGVAISGIAAATAATGVSVTPAGNISSINVQLALQELDGEKQPLDSTLTSIALLGTAADRYAYTTGVDTWAEGTITAVGRAILDDATASDQRTTLGLAINTNVQAYDAFLTSIASLGTAADKMIYTTAVDTAAEAAITSFARSILDDADEATFKATVNLEIGTDIQAYDADTLKSDVTKTLTVGYSTTPYSAGTKSTGTFTPDEANGAMQYYTNGGAHTLAPPTNNCTLVIQITNNSSAGAITTSGFTKVTGTAPGTTDGNDYLAFITKINGFSHLAWQALQ